MCHSPAAQPRRQRCFRAIRAVSAPHHPRRVRAVSAPSALGQRRLCGGAALEELGLDSLSVQGRAEGGQVRRDLCDEEGDNVVLADGEEGLDDIVCERVVQQRGERLGRGQLVGDHRDCGRVARLEALFDHVGGELLEGELREAAAQRLHDRVRERRLAQVEDILHDVIAKRVDDELGREPHDLADDLLAVRRRGVVQAALQHAAAVPVRRDGEAIRDGAVIDARGQLGGQRGEAALHHVVRVHVADELHDRGQEGGAQGRLLGGTVGALHHLLHHARPVHVERDLDHPRDRAVDECGALLAGAVLH
mmetsp:Transcript_47175/g.152855  ORF Transcript_47175/g.152855 Transcript_47175/m.152855 type:complete len:307 (-) Transcript_47175:1106-2026(-)